jgi:hypothetical protein
MKQVVFFINGTTDAEKVSSRQAGAGVGDCRGWQFFSCLSECSSGTSGSSSSDT